MTFTQTEFAGTSDTNPFHRLQAGDGRFMVTLCTLDAPVVIRPPQSPRLKPYRFFTSQVCLPDGSQRLYLHMGYFDSLSDAEKWAETARRRYPGAFATVATGFSSEVNVSAAASSSASASEPADFGRVAGNTLTDTQVLSLLETRTATIGESVVLESHVSDVGLLRPDDTVTRRALREAVVQGAPVSFAVQLRWSTEPIDVSRVPSAALYKPHTLYVTESRRKGHHRHFLRLGFFADAFSAKQVAAQLRSIFAAAAVIPVVEPEITRAQEAKTRGVEVPFLQAQQEDWQDDSDRESESPSTASLRSARTRAGLEGRQEDWLAGNPLDKDSWAEADALSESGVRHLRVEVQEQLSGRWKVIRLKGPPTQELRS